MDIVAIVAVVFGIVLLIIAFRVVKSLVKLFLYLSILLLVVSVVFGYLAFTDALSFGRNVKVGQNIFLLRENDQIQSGFISTGLDVTKFTEISGNEMIAVNTFYQNEEFEKILENNYKIFYFSEKAFFNVEIVDEFADLPQDDTLVFLSKVGSGMENDRLFLVKSLKNGDLEVYPQTIIFKMFKYLGGN